MSAKKLTRILYVEDDADIRTIAQIALESLGGFELLVCESGREAVERAASFEPDLILLDVMMPGMDGPTTLGELRLRKDLASVPAVFMTAKVQPAEMKRYRELGAAGVIVKPFDPMTLADEVRRIWNERTSE